MAINHYKKINCCSDPQNSRWHRIMLEQNSLSSEVIVISNSEEVAGRAVGSKPRTNEKLAAVPQKKKTPRERKFVQNVGG